MARICEKDFTAYSPTWVRPRPSGLVLTLRLPAVLIGSRLFLVRVLGVLYRSIPVDTTARPGSPGSPWTAYASGRATNDTCDDTEP